MLRSIALSLVFASGCAAPAEPRFPPRVHPLDPLTASEIERTAGVLRESGRVPPGAFFPLMVLHEPRKGESDPPREAFVVAFDRPANRTYEAVVDLGGAGLRSWRHVPDAQPPLLDDEFERVPALVRAHPAWREAMRRRGITDPDQVLIDLWAGTGPGPRTARAIGFRQGEGAAAYGRPIEGVVAVVDLNELKVLEVRDTGVRPVARAVRDPSPAPAAPRASRRSPAPFALRGHEIRWGHWVLRYAFHPREALVLHEVGFGEGVARPVAHRLSLSEIVVPYGDPDPNWAWRCAFDAGEYGLGRHANRLEAGREVPEDAVLLDATVADERGAPARLERVVAVYERDGGVLWSHFDDATGRTETRRSRQLVVACVFTIGNYDYGLSWIFHPDGTLEAEVMATGILLAKGTEATSCGACPGRAAGRSAPAAGDERHGTLVAEHVVAPNHQHFFGFRLDLDVDGPGNSVAEMNVGDGLVAEETVLEGELRARRRVSLEAHRSWKVFNPSVRTALGHLPGYRLVPGENSVPHVVLPRAGFIDHHVWLTRYRREEMNAAGPYPNQHAGGDGLPRWTADDEPLVGEDVVLWYTLGLTHVARPEEWPVMPASRARFKLVPSGFLSRRVP